MNVFSVMSTPLLLARVFLNIFLRDRQAIFFTIFFPVIFMLALGLRSDGNTDLAKIGVVNQFVTEASEQFVQRLKESDTIQVSLGTKEELLSLLNQQTISAVLILPANFTAESRGAEATVILDSAHLDDGMGAISLLEKSLVMIERDMRATEAMLTLDVKDVQSRTLRYIDFLLPGILAFTLMQISIAGSGFNIVEYRRKGILKRLFVTPIRPVEFISGVVLARLLMCVTQISVLLVVAIFYMKVQIQGSIFALYTTVFLSAIIFLCIGFALGSIAKTQQSIQALGNLIIFPQIFLSGIFYPIDSLPGFMQPIAHLLPLSFVATALREIASNGLGLLDIWPQMVGILVWLGLSFFAATKWFVWREVAN